MGSNRRVAPYEVDLRGVWDNLTRFKKNDAGGPLTAAVQCLEHAAMPARAQSWPPPQSQSYEQQQGQQFYGAPGQQYVQVPAFTQPPPKTGMPVWGWAAGGVGVVAVIVVAGVMAFNGLASGSKAPEAVPSPPPHCQRVRSAGKVSRGGARRRPWGRR